MPKTDRDAGMELADALRRGIADNSFCVAVRGGEVSISFSMGVAVPHEGDTDESILQRADQAMYRAKRTGRNHVECEQPEDEPPAGLIRSPFYDRDAKPQAARRGTAITHGQCETAVGGFFSYAAWRDWILWSRSTSNFGLRS